MKFYAQYSFKFLGGIFINKFDATPLNSLKSTRLDPNVYKN